MKLLIVKETTLEVAKGNGEYLEGEWYDNVSREHADKLLASGAGIEVEQAACRCLIAKNGRLVRRTAGCTVEHGS